MTSEERADLRPFPRVRTRESDSAKEVQSRRVEGKNRTRSAALLNRTRAVLKNRSGKTSRKKSRRKNSLTLKQLGRCVHAAYVSPDNLFGMRPGLHLIPISPLVAKIFAEQAEKAKAATEAGR